MINSFFKVNKIINNYLGIKYFFLILSFIFSAIIQSLGVVSVAPLVIVFFKIDELSNNIYFEKFIKILNLNFDSQNFLILFSVFFIFIVFLSGILRIFNSTISIYIGEKIVKNLKSNYLNKYLSLKIDKIVNINKSKFRAEQEVIINKRGEFIKRFFNFIINLASSMMLMLVIFVIDKKIFYSLVFCFLIFFLIYLSLKNLNKKFFNQELATSNELIKIINNISFGFIEIIINKLKNVYLDEFNKLENKKIIISIKKGFFSLFPRYVLEVVVYTILILYLLQLHTNDQLTTSIPSLAVIGFAIIKYIPLVYSIYSDILVLDQNSHSINYNLNIPYVSEKEIKSKNKINSFTKKINLEMDFAYDKSKKFNYLININKTDKISIEGNSGNGKTTLLNLLCGIIKADKIKNFKIDGINIFTDLKGYWSLISYLPQEPLIFEGSVMDNITLFEDNSKIKYKRLKKIYNIVGLKQIIDKFENLNSLMINFDSKQISGGQKQRILLARALYKNAELYIFDEPLNQLDEKSEIKILNNIKKNFANKTFVIVSHRPYKKFFNRKIYI